LLIRQPVLGMPERHRGMVQPRMFAVNLPFYPYQRDSAVKRIIDRNIFLFRLKWAFRDKSRNAPDSAGLLADRF